MYTREQIQKAVEEKGYKWFSGTNYDVNVVGVRTRSLSNAATDVFDDFVTISYRHKGEWQFNCFPATTDPGAHWLLNLLNPNGTAILKPGQYRRAYKIGLHQGKYKALVQKAPVKVYRDKDRNKSYDFLEQNVMEGMFGINVHRATVKGTSTQVGKWSAGCQVIASSEDFQLFMTVLETASRIWGNTFTYTLLESYDIK